jgi:uncharacterized protein (TIGR00255 family)
VAKVYSMTGFGLGVGTLGVGSKVAPAALTEPVSPDEVSARVTLELRSVNSRFLDIIFKLPDELRPFEAALRDAIAARCKRGKIEVRAQVERREALPSAVNELAITALLAAQTQMLTHDANAKRLSVSDLLRWPGVLSADTPDDSLAQEQKKQAAIAALNSALDTFAASRASEGDKLALFLLERCDAIDRYAEQAKTLAPLAAEKQQQRFIERWNEALKLAAQQMNEQDASSISERAHERALSEAASFALRIDIAEEIGRLLAHTSECRTLLAKGGELGKRLDFLVQELHREANTLGSKSASLEHTKLAIELKVLVEQMREQVQNIE